VTCALILGQGRYTKSPLQVSGPFYCIGMDYKVMDPRKSNHYALMFQDYLTKWPEVYAVADHKATVGKCLADVIWRHGMP